MANIKKFESKNVGINKNAYENKIKVHKRRIIFRIFCTLIVLGLLVFLLVFYGRKKEFTSYEVLAEHKMEGSVISNYLKYGNDILSYSKDGITCLNTKNVSLWKQTFEMQDPMISVGNEFVIVGDYKGGKIYILNKSGLQSEINTMKPIIQLDVSDQGVVAAVLDDDTTTWILLYNKDGKEIAKIKTTLKDSGYPISIDLSADGLKLGVSYLQMSNGILSTSIAFYNFGSVGQNEIDNLVSGYDYSNMIAPTIRFINNSTAVAVGDNTLLFYKGNQKPKLEKKIELQEEIQDVFYSDKYVALVFKDISTNTKYRLDLYDDSGNKVLTKKINLDFKEIVINMEQILLYNETEMEILQINGNRKFYGKLENSAIKIIPDAGRSKFLIITNDSTQMIKLK